MSSQIIESRKVFTVESLISILQAFSTVDPATIFVKGATGYEMRVSLEETTLTDGSIVYDIILTEERSADDKAVR